MKHLKLFSLVCLNMFVCSFILSIFSYIPVSAMSVKDIKGRNACNTLAYELAYANNDGGLSTKACYSTYQEAKNVMNNSTEADSDNLVILERKNSITEIIDARFALVDYDQKINATSNLYKNLGDSSAFTYITGGGSDDAAFLGFDYNSRRIKIMVSGFTGWLDKYDSDGNNQYDIIPLSWVISPQYYKVGDATITHYLPINLFTTSAGTPYTFGQRPSQLSPGTYYSYDGKYFYKDLKTMLSDYLAGNRNRSVNANAPYYNYYLYLPHRTKSNYSVADINDYISFLGYNSKATEYPIPSKKQSMLYNEGDSFYSAESLYGVNSILMFGVARNESGNGRSRISVLKNNIFGHNAVDSDPYAKGDAYQTVGYGIYAHAYKWLSYGFLQPGDYNGRFNGGHLGNKATGVNVKYASDPYWGEKAASYYYQLDSKYGFQDYYYYSVAVKNDDSTVVYPKKSPSTSGLNVSSKYYKLTLKDTPIVIVEEVKGDSVNGNSTWYKIMSDPMLDSSLEYTGSSKSNPRVTYNWDSNYVYVPAAYFTKINDATPKNPNDVIKHDKVIVPPDSGNTGDSNGGNTPSTDSSEPLTNNPAAGLHLRESNLYYFESLNYSNNRLNVSGFLAMTGMHNRSTDTITHRLIFKNVDSGQEYLYTLDRWITNVPFAMTNSDETVKYDYSGGWFKGSIDVSKLPQGDYQVFVEENNGTYRTRTYFNNLFFKDMIHKFSTSNGKGFNFQMNYYDKRVPMEVSVRDGGLISSATPPTSDMMYNSFEKMEFTGNSLRIRGTSHNVGVGYGAGVSVNRKIVFENTSTFERYTYDVGSITNGDYTVSLRASDGKDKTRAWFDAKMDISALPRGVYAIYIKTSGQGGEDYGELNDILYTSVNQRAVVSGKTASLRRVDSKRFRIELVIE